MAFIPTTDTLLRDMHHSMQYDIQGNPSLRSKFPSAEFLLGISNNTIEDGVYPFLKFGVTNGGGLPSGQQETVWQTGGLYPWSVWNSGAATLNVAASSIGEEGARVVISGLDQDWNLIEETVTLDGTNSTTIVPTIATFIRVNEAWVLDELVAANVTIKYGATTVAEVYVTEHKSQMAVYSVPAGYTLFVFMGTTSAGKGGDANFGFYVRRFGSVFQNAHAGWLYQNIYSWRSDSPRPLPEKSDFDFRAVSSNTGTSLSMGFSLMLIENTLLSALTA